MSESDPTPKPRFPFTCDDELYEKLRTLAHQERRSMVEILREALAEKLAVVPDVAARRARHGLQ